MTETKPPKVFISYSWDDDAHKRWVRNFAARLLEHGVDVTLDCWEAVPGAQLPKFMETAVRENNFVLVICTPKYKEKMDNRKGGVGYEGDIMTGEIFVQGNAEKFIPILRIGEWEDVAPSAFMGKYYIDLHGESYSEDSYQDLLTTLFGIREKKPPRGKTPDFSGIDFTPKEIKETREKYLRKFIEKYSRPERPAILDLGTYINLPVGVGDSPTQDEKSKDFDSIFAISKLPEKWILLGDAGSGKTATIRDLACFQARQCLDNPKSPIPVLINLWTWRGESSTFSNFFEAFIDDSSNQNLFGLLRNLQDTPVKLLQENKLSLYLDGLDELPASKVRLLKEWLSKTDLSVGLTCREADFIGIRKLELPSISLKPLGWDQITIFAEKFLGESAGADFVSNVVEAKAGERIYEEHHLFRFVQTPFFLLLILAYYKQSGKVEFNRWRLFKYVVEQLWGSDRIQELITTYKLAKDYSASSQIVRFLSNWGMKFIQNQIIDRKQFEKNANGRLLEVLVESTLIQMNEDQIRFRHPLFADYYAANNALEWTEYDQLSEDISKWSGMFVVLAGSSEKTRKRIQNFLIDIISSHKGWEGFMEEKRGPLWILGEIGDSNAIPLLVDLHNNTKNASDAWLWFATSSANHIFAGTSCLTAAGRISRRLPDNDINKKELIQFVVDELFSKPTSINWDNRETDNSLDDSNKKNYGWMAYQQILLNAWNLVLAIGEVGGEQASKILYDGLLYFNEHYSSMHMWSNNVRVLGFAVALARLGISGIPTLLDILSSEDPQISHVAADALYILSYPVPSKLLFKTLALHPDAVVRTSVARKLGRSKKIEVIPHLVAALNDKGIITRSHPMERWNAHYFHVADSAAEALAVVGTEECISIIKERLYNADGSISIELSLERLRQWTETELRTYEARKILRQNGLLSLLPLMGHLDNVETSVIDPIAEAIIYHQKNIGGDVIPQLLHYLSNSEDTLSRRWVLIILGTIGNVHVEEFLNNFLSTAYKPLIRDGAARGLGLLISNNLDVHDEQEILSKFITGLGEIPASSYGGVGWGVAEIVRAYADIQSPNALSIIQAILDYFFQGNLENSKSALDALESIYIKIKQSYIKNSETKQELDAFFELKVMPILIESPSYLMKLANHLVVEGDSSTNIDEAIGAFVKVIGKKENPPAWALHYTESDWIQLGCSDIEIQYRMGDILYEAKRYQESLEHYEKVLKLFDLKKYQDHYLLSLFHKSLNKAGLLHIYFEEFKQAIELFRKIIDLKDNNAVDNYLLLNTWMGLQRAYSEDKQWLELLETAMKALKLADKIYGRYLDRCSIRINIGSAYVGLGEFDKAFVCWQEAENLADFYGLHEILVELIFRRASLYFALGREDLVESDFEKAESYYKKIEDWSEAANILGQLSEKVFKDDPARRISMFQKALSYLDLLQSPLESPNHAFFFYKVALAYQELSDSSNAELNFQKALSALEKQKISELKAYIWVDFGRFLHEIGRTEEGTQYAMRGIAIQSELGLDESYGEKALREMSSNPEWRIPSSVLSMMFNAIINSLTTEPELTNEVLKRLEDMLNRARDQSWKEEEELLISLRSIASGQMPKLLETNPYFETFTKFELELKNAIENANNVEQDGITIIQLLQQVERVLRGDRELGQKLFSFTQRMAVSSDNPPEIQEFGRVLTNILAGNRNPDLSALTEEFSSAIRIMLESLKR